MKEINNYSNYLIYDDGRVFSKKRNKFLIPDKLKKQHTTYHRYTLSKNGSIERFTAHRLVAEHYIPNLNNLPDVNHKDNNGENNHVSNLEWCTHSENMKHCHSQGRCSNIIASEVAKEKNHKEMELKFKGILGNRYISHTTKNKRGYITFNCICCNKEVTSRTDSTSFKKGGVCVSCVRKKKI